MDNCISSRTRSNVTPDSINNWKICENNFKIPRRSVSRISTNIKKYKKDIISIINNEIGDSKNKYETSIHELNYLQRGHIFILYKDIQSSTEVNSCSTIIKMENDYEFSKKYFIDDSDDSDPEYFEIDEIINRINAERCILNRVEELKQNNLWSSKMLSKKPDPSKPMFHSDLLIKEMKWLQGNLSNIKQIKRVEAKKLAIAASKYIKEKEAQMAKNNKEETIRARKQCLIISKMIKEWWKQMQKIVSAKQKFRIDAKRQEAINDHLGMVIETTKKYTEWLTEDLKVINSGDNDTSIDDPDFQIKDEVTDDEATLIEDEIELNINIEEEIEDLKLQNEKTLEDILKELPVDYFKPMTEINNNIMAENQSEVKSCNKSVEEDKESDLDDEYCFNSSNVDKNSDLDENKMSEDESDTINEQENYEAKNRSSNTMEIEALMNDAEMPLEELLNIYKKMHSSSEINDIEHNVMSVEEDSISYCSEKNSPSDILESENELSDKESCGSSYESSVDLRTIFNIEKEEFKEDDSSQFKDQFQEITKVAMSTQPTGFTLESADVKVQVPFLLKFPLREYQHVGLDWMAAIYEKRLNGVLADEMGLGKTIQTISLLAYLSCEKGTWGPHLVIVPTSVVLNWEIEFKKWCPGFKILTYFGTFKERKEKRKGWTKTNAFHVCITSYKLAIQDCQVFKRKKWKYMILDEAQNIKNFKSQRWQTLLTFNSQRRLLLTGTPLQNNLMELWSLMHFLMPSIFQSHREFHEWFGSPLSGMIEGSNEYNEQLVMRLHKILRPFILRRLKKDVEKQMPQKIEHLIMCSLSKRQRFLYDDFMSLTSTKEMLSSGQFMNIISILMQLRKVCNHPNLFEDRPTLSPFSMNQESIGYDIPRILLIDEIYENRLTNGKQVMPAGTIGLADLALNLPKFVSERILGLVCKENLIEEIDNIQVTDWVSKFSEKYTDPPPQSSFIPGDLIDFLNKSETGTEKSIKLPKPLIYSLKIKKVLSSNEDNVLPSSIVNNRKHQRISRLHTMSIRNTIRCCQMTSYGPDITSAVNVFEPINEKYGKTINILKRKTLEEFLKDNIEQINRVTFVIPAVLSCGIRLNTSSRTLLNFRSKSETLYCQSNSAILVNLSQIRQNQLVQFPDTRLIEYDCGKLQVLVSLLKKLKFEGHRCLIFTQMTRMLDILEQFLSYHGYRYLRLDGTTKIEQRQIMMEQFNKDERIFVFILSTRSGGVGVNLTGADTVIFYDSDWNPTMDAQAQDRCHRIGQTRDVHIYRLISRMTIEENILKKANEKRHLNEMAIEGGQFNMSYFKSNLLQDIFQTPTGLENQSFIDEPVDLPKTYTTSRGRTIRCKGGNKAIYNFKNNNIDTQEKEDTKAIDSTQLEAALEEVEDENDRLAARMTMAENKADLVEFDETVPWEDTEDNNSNVKNENDENKFRLEMESQLENFNAQLDPLQRYGVAWIEQSEENVLCTQLEMEDLQIENNKQTWELEQLKALHEDQEEMRNIDEDDMLYIYGEYDPAAAQREELEKLRKEEEMEQLKKQREEEEIVRREKEKAVAQAWAQEQHRNALKRKSENADENCLNISGNPETVTRGPKQRKIVVPRMELPDESITTAKTIITFNANDDDQPLHSSSSSSMVIDSISFRNRKSKNISKYSPDWENTDPNSGYQSNSSQIHSNVSLSPPKTNAMIDDDLDSETTLQVRSSKYLSKFHKGDVRLIYNSFNDENYFVFDNKKYFHSLKHISRPMENILSNKNNLASHIHNEMEKCFSEKTKSIMSAKINNNIIPKPFPQPKRMGRPPWKNIIKPVQDADSNGLIKRKFTPTKRYGRLSHKSFQLAKEKMETNVGVQRKLSLPSKDSVSKFPELVLMNNVSCTTQNADEFVSNISFKKKRGRPSHADIQEKANLDQKSRNRSCSDSHTNVNSINKKNSFKIPVKTLNGEHKLFSAPLLLLKTKLVFVVTRKIEDNKGNTYTQNLTYPIECNESFNEIASKLSSFALSNAGKH